MPLAYQNFSFSIKFFPPHPNTGWLNPHFSINISWFDSHQILSPISSKWVLHKNDLHHLETNSNYDSICAPGRRATVSRHCRPHVTLIIATITFLDNADFLPTPPIAQVEIQPAINSKIMVQTSISVGMGISVISAPYLSLFKAEKDSKKRMPLHFSSMTTKFALDCKP